MCVLVGSAIFAVAWFLPSASAHTGVILISKAELLDANKAPLKDISGALQAHDNVWTSVAAGQYMRVTFAQLLTHDNDITVYAAPTDRAQLSTLEVFPVYTDRQGRHTEGGLLAPVSDGVHPTFETIDHTGTYRILLSNLRRPTDTFDLKVSKASVSVDYVVDPPYTWAAPSFTGVNSIFWQDLAMSQDGVHMLAGGFGAGRLWMSANSGGTWSEVQPDGNANKTWYSVAISNDGTHMMATQGVGGSGAWLSSNSGVSWSLTKPSGTNTT
jgi:hypothetical protein